MSRKLDYEALAEKNCKCDDNTCAWCVSENNKAKARWAANLARGWKEEKCGCAGGTVYDEGIGGVDCNLCGGQGFVWRSPSGKHAALYPGGPFVE